MKTVIAKGKPYEVSDNPTGAEIARVANLHPSRRILKRTREGLEFIGHNQRISVQDGDRFTDAPQRAKLGDRR